MTNSFDLSGQTAVITGGGGVLCSSMACTLAAEGVNIVVADIDLKAAQSTVDRIRSRKGEGHAALCDVNDQKSILNVVTDSLRLYGKIDILINGAGGNKVEATVRKDHSFFDLLPADIDRVFKLNFTSTLNTCQIVGKVMADQRTGVIVNISSMNAIRPLTKIPAYSAAKAAVSNFTQWLAVYLAQEFSPEIRVNAIAPGFFLTEQNRYLLFDQTTGELSDRGKNILTHTPQQRFGSPEDLSGTLLWLVSYASRFVTGIVVPVDGGFSAYSGV